jgi:DNA-binding MarR family transcriptional regulator
MDQQKMKTWRALQWAHTVILRTLEREMEAEGLPLAWFDVLIHLAEAPDGQLRMQDLAGSIVMSPSGLTRLTDRMEKADYVTRQRTAEDRRGAYAVITPKGKAELERIWPIHLRGIEQHFAANVDDADVPALYAALSRIIVGVEGPTSSYASD